MSLLASARSAVAVLQKDIRSELRTRYSLNSLGLFAITALAVMSFSANPYSLDPDVQSAFLWIVVFFSAITGLSRSFVKEEESRTALALRLSASPDQVYLGKLGFNLILLFSLVLVIVPGFLLLMDIAPKSPGVFVSGVIAGTAGLGAASTIIAAIVARSNSKGALFAVLAFPLSLPVLASAVKVTVVGIQGGDRVLASGDLRLLAAYFGIMVALSLALFEYVWED